MRESSQLGERIHLYEYMQFGKNLRFRHWQKTCKEFVLVPEYYFVPLMNLRVDQLKEGTRVESQRARRSPRIRLQVPVFLRASDTSGTEFIELTRTLNISATGACITSTHLLRPEQTVLLTIPAPSPSSSSLIPSETPPIQAKVRRQETLGDQRLFGLEFVRPLE